MLFPIDIHARHVLHDEHEQNRGDNHGADLSHHSEN